MADDDGDVRFCEPDSDGNAGFSRLQIASGSVDWFYGTQAAYDYFGVPCSSGRPPKLVPVGARRADNSRRLTIVSNNAPIVQGIILYGSVAVPERLYVRYCVSAVAPSASAAESGDVCGGAPAATSGPYVEANVAGWGTRRMPFGGIFWGPAGSTGGHPFYEAATSPAFAGVTMYDWTDVADGALPSFSQQTSRYGDPLSPRAVVSIQRANASGAIFIQQPRASNAEPFDCAVALQIACPTAGVVEEQYVHLVTTRSATSIRGDVLGEVVLRVVCDTTPKTTIATNATGVSTKMNASLAGASGTFSATTVYGSPARGCVSPGDREAKCQAAVPQAVCFAASCPSGSDFEDVQIVSDLSGTCGLVAEDKREECCRVQFRMQQEKMCTAFRTCNCGGPAGSFECPSAPDCNLKSVLDIILLILGCLATCVFLIYVCAIIYGKISESKRRRERRYRLHSATPTNAFVALPDDCGVQVQMAGALPAPSPSDCSDAATVPHEATPRFVDAATASRCATASKETSS